MSSSLMNSSLAMNDLAPLLASSEAVASLPDGLAVASAFSEVYVVILWCWAEIAFFLFFLAGAWILNSGRFKFKDSASPWFKDLPSSVVRKADLFVDSEEQCTLSSIGVPDDVLKSWLATGGKAQLADELKQYPKVFDTARFVAGILEFVARHGTEEDLDKFWSVMHDYLRILPSTPVCEVLLGGYAGYGNVAKVHTVSAMMSANSFATTTRGYLLTIKGYLRHFLLEEAKEQLLWMHRDGHKAVATAVTLVVTHAAAADKAEHVIHEFLDAGITIPAEATEVVVAEFCAKRERDMPSTLLNLVTRGTLELTHYAYGMLLKHYARQGSMHAVDIFDYMQEHGCVLTEALGRGQTIQILVRCTEGRFSYLAEKIMKHVRETTGANIPMYGVVIKVYASCGEYDKACDLYQQVVEDGLTPDSALYGCVMKCAAECDRTELVMETSQKVDGFRFHDYTCLMRAASRQKDVEAASRIMEQMKAAGMKPDLLAYNCLLDVYSSNCEMERARELVNQMKVECGELDTVTYNTLLKGFFQCGDLAAGRAVLAEMSAAGCPPDGVSWNSLINATVHGSTMREAFALVDEMEQDGVGIDGYTVSILMKGLHRKSTPQDVQQALALVYRSGVDIFTDHVLFNSVLDACVRHREFRHVNAMIDQAVGNRILSFDVSSYAAIMKACSAAGRTADVVLVWNAMVDSRALIPNQIVLGCLIEALVAQKNIDRAMTEFDKWKVAVRPTRRMFSTLVKGLAATNLPTSAERAMALWREFKDGTVICLAGSNVVYNTLIDSQARVGAIKDMETLVEAMVEAGCELDSVTYSTIVKGYCVKGKIDLAYDLFKTMHSGGMLAKDAITFNTMLDGCHRHQRFELAEQLLEEMDTFGVSATSYTLGILVKLFGRRRQLDRLFEVMQTFPKRYNFEVTVEVLTCLLCTCVTIEELDKAFEVFADIKRKFSTADARAYTSLIGGCVRRGLVKVAVHLVEEALGLPSEAGVRCSRRGLSKGQYLEVVLLKTVLGALRRERMADTEASLKQRLMIAKALPARA